MFPFEMIIWAKLFNAHTKNAFIDSWRLLTFLSGGSNLIRSNYLHGRKHCSLYLEFVKPISSHPPIDIDRPLFAWLFSGDRTQKCSFAKCTSNNKFDNVQLALHSAGNMGVETCWCLLFIERWQQVSSDDYQVEHWVLGENNYLRRILVVVV